VEAEVSNSKSSNGGHQHKAGADAPRSREASLRLLQKVFR